MSKKDTELDNLNSMILYTQMKIRDLEMNLRIFKHTKKELQDKVK